MSANKKTYVSPEIQKELLNEIYIEKIDDVLAEYATLFRQHPLTRHNKELSGYYANLSLLIKNIRFGTVSYTQTEVDNYLRKAHAAKIRAEVFA